MSNRVPPLIIYAWPSFPSWLTGTWAQTRYPDMAVDYMHRPALLRELEAMLQDEETPEAETTNATIRAVMEMVRDKSKES